MGEGFLDRILAPLQPLIDILQAIVDFIKDAMREARL